MKDDEITTEIPQEQSVEEEEIQSESPFVLKLPIQDEQIAELRVGQWVHLSGTLNMIGHQAGILLMEHWEEEQELEPAVNWDQAAIYFATPGNAPLGAVIGSLAPHYSHDFDGLSQQLCHRGVRCLIGRGPISDDAAQSLKQKRGVYLVTVGSAGALLASTVHQAQMIAMEDLGREAIRALKVERFPCVVAIDGFGRNLFKSQSKSPEELSTFSEHK